MSLYTVDSIISDIARLTQRFNPRELEIVSEKLLIEAADSVVLSKIALDRAREIVASFPYAGVPWTLIFIYSGIASSVFALLFIWLCLGSLHKRTQNITRQMRMQRIKDMSPDTDSNEGEDVEATGDECHRRLIEGPPVSAKNFQRTTMWRTGL